jgi:hypothetical protein
MMVMVVRLVAAGTRPMGARNTILTLLMLIFTCVISNRV